MARTRNFRLCGCTLNPGASRPTDNALREQLLGPDGRPVSRAWAVATLVIMLLLIRELRALMAPYADLNAIGDVFEAALAFCDPEDKARLPVRDAFGAAHGITSKEFQATHARIEELIKAMAKLLATARHHPETHGVDCPTTWAEMQSCDFPLFPTLVAIASMVVPATTSGRTSLLQSLGGR